MGKINESTIASRLSLLKNIYGLYKKPNADPIGAYLKGYKVPRDYSKLLFDNGIIERIGGKRGPGKYKWVGPPPDYEFTKELIRKYNLLRSNQQKISGIINRTEVKIINKKLDFIIDWIKSQQRQSDKTQIG